MRHRILTIFFIGFIVHLVFSFLPGLELDMAGWRAWPFRLLELGPPGFYSEEVWTHYLPGYLYPLWGFGVLAKIFSLDPYSFVFSLILKLPSTIADLGIAFLIIKILEKRVSSAWAYFSSSLYLFNPIVLFNGPIWGQIDSVLTFFLLLSFYFIVDKGRPYWGIISFTLAFLIKPQAIAIFPLLLFILWKKFSLRTIIKSGVLGLFCIFLLSLPFFPKNPFLGLPELFLRMTNDYPFTSLFAFNLWWIIGGWQSDTATQFILSNQAWGTIFWLISQLVLFLLLIRKKIDLYLAASFSLFTFFLFPTRVHERYLFPFFAFFAVSFPALSYRSWLTLYLGLSSLHLANLYFVYTYWQPNYLKLEFLFSLIKDTSPILSLATIFLFLQLLLSIIEFKK